MLWFSKKKPAAGTLAVNEGKSPACIFQREGA